MTDTTPATTTLTIHITTPDQTHARRWAQTLADLVQAEHGQHMRLGVQITEDGHTAPPPQPPLTWCGASMPGAGCEPIGPCVLRHGHDGPVHQTADGARWWPTNPTEGQQ